MRSEKIGLIDWEFSEEREVLYKLAAIIVENQVRLFPGEDVDEAVSLAKSVLSFEGKLQKAKEPTK